MGRRGVCNGEFVGASGPLTVVLHDDRIVRARPRGIQGHIVDDVATCASASVVIRVANAAFEVLGTI